MSKNKINDGHGMLFILFCYYENKLSPKGIDNKLICLQ